jgi:hypothetical protein
MDRIALILILACLYGCDAKQSDTPTQEHGRLVTECTVTCPGCGHKKKETMPDDMCLGKYTCDRCNKTLTPVGEDCCVFCSYGDTICPPEQELLKKSE